MADKAALFKFVIHVKHCNIGYFPYADLTIDF